MANLDSEPLDCPYPMFHSLIILWTNFTSPDLWHGDSYYFQSYVCRFSSYWSFRDRCAQWEGYSVLSLGAFGFVGALCKILTLRQSQFRQLDFVLFRTVAYLELIQMADVTAMTALAYFRCEYYYVCAFVWAHVATTVANVCSDAVDLIVLYLSVERTVACLLPHYFRALHNLNNYHLVEILCFVFPSIFSTLQAFELTVFYDKTEERYLEEPSTFSQSDFYGGVVLVNMIRFYCTATLISTATFSSVIGLITVERRRSKLKQRGGSGGGAKNRFADRETTIIDPRQAQQRRQSSDDSLTTPPPVPRYSRILSMLSTTRILSSFVAHSNDSNVGLTLKALKRGGAGGTSKTGCSQRNRRQTELCCLQLCLALPVVSNLILYASGLTTSHYSFNTGKSVFETNITFEKAMKEIDMAQTFQYLRTSTNISNVLAHALHFYLYLLFSHKVRQGFANLLKRLFSCGRWKAKTSGSSSVATSMMATGNRATHLEHTVVGVGLGGGLAGTDEANGHVTERLLSNKSNGGGAGLMIGGEDVGGHEISPEGYTRANFSPYLPD